MSRLDSVIEAAALRETEKFLREFVQAALNTGILAGSMVLMLRRVADDLVPPIEMLEPPETIQ